MPAGPVTEQPGAPFASRRVDASLRARISSRGRRRGLEHVGAAAARRARRRRRGAPGGDGLPCPAGLLADRLEAIAREAARIVASPRGPFRAMHRLEAGSGGDEVAATMPWPCAPRVTAASPVRTRHAPASSGRAGDHGDELEGGPHRALGVVLVGRRGTPDGHHRVTDELLDRPAVAADDLRRRSKYRTASRHILSVALLGEWGEPDEIGEEDGDQAAFSDGPSRRRGREPRALAAGRSPIRAIGVGLHPSLSKPSWVPQSPQKPASGSFGAPQPGHVGARARPQRRQISGSTGSRFRNPRRP